MAARLHWDQHIARPEAVVSELAASATMPVRAVQCREIARRIDSARQCTRTALTSAAKIPYVFQITKMFFTKRKTEKAARAVKRGRET